MFKACVVFVHGRAGRDGSCNEADDKLASKYGPPSKLVPLLLSPFVCTYLGLTPSISTPFVLHHGSP